MKQNEKQAHGNKMPSATKKGPGRYHEQGHKKNKAKGMPMSAAALAAIKHSQAITVGF